jgi:hypothetical protein
MIRILLPITLMLLPNVAMSYETAKYEVVKKIDDRVEIRKYDNLITAEVETTDNDDSSFLILFRYITGKNIDQKEISMTTPVFIDKKASDKSVMKFVMPSEFKIKDLPTPGDGRIKFKTQRGKEFVAIRFSGFAFDSNFKKREKQLREVVKENKIRIKEPEIWAYYNQPFSLPFLKRNEVLFQIQN